MNPCRTWAPHPNLSVQHMRWVSGLEGEQDLVAYWKFNDAGAWDPCAVSGVQQTLEVYV